MDRFDRCQKLFGTNFDKLQKANIIVLGVGGVGGYVVDCLYKSGVQNITIVDYDSFELSNQNRQIGSEYLGESKVEVFQKLYPKIQILNMKLNPQIIDEFDFDKFDFIIDAIDDIPTKVRLISKYYKKVISSGGSAKKTNPLQLEYKDIFQTYNDPLLKKLRYYLKKIGFNKKFKVLFSKEEIKTNSLGSFVGVTGSFGLALCSICIEKILNNYKNL